MSNIVHGRNLIVKLDGVAIAANKSCTISIEGEQVEIASMTSAQWREYIAGRKGWNVTTNHLVTHGILLSAADLVNHEVELSFSFCENHLHTDDGATMKGRAIIAQFQSEATIGSLAKGSFRFLGNGELTTENHYTYFDPKGDKDSFDPKYSGHLIVRKYQH